MLLLYAYLYHTNTLCATSTQLGVARLRNSDSWALMRSSGAVRGVEGAELTSAIVIRYGLGVKHTTKITLATQHLTILAAARGRTPSSSAVCVVGVAPLYSAQVPPMITS